MSEVTTFEEVMGAIDILDRYVQGVGSFSGHHIASLIPPETLDAIVSGSYALEQEKDYWTSLEEEQWYLEDEVYQSGEFDEEA